MANLIITVISIALVAVAALMGAYYGGTAFLDGQAKAQANQIIAGAEQAANAWRSYALDNGGNYYLPNSNDWRGGSAPDLVPKYLAQLPSYAFINLVAGSKNYFTVGNFDTALHFGSGGSGNQIIFALGVPDEVCKQINFIATGVKTIGPNISTINSASYFNPFACVVYTPGTFIYRVT